MASTLTPRAPARTTLRQRRRYSSTHEDYVPGNINPEQEQRHHAERAINDLVGRKVRDIKTEPIFGDLKTARGEKAAPERRLERNAPRGKKRVEQRECKRRNCYRERRSDERHGGGEKQAPRGRGVPPARRRA